MLGGIQYLCDKKPCTISINTMSANNENFNKLRADVARLNSTQIATTRMELQKSGERKLEESAREFCSEIGYISS